MTPDWDWIEIDALNIGTLLVMGAHHVWFPDTFYEGVTWVLSSLSLGTLIVLNYVKIKQMLKGKKHDKE